MCGENYVGEFGRNVVLRWEDHEDINKQAELGKDLKIFPDRSSRSEVFLVECVLKICSKFTGEHLLLRTPLDACFCPDHQFQWKALARKPE